MNEIIKSLIRAVLKIGGGYLVARGISNNDTTEVIVNGLVALIGVAWGVLDRKRKHER